MSKINNNNNEQSTAIVTQTELVRIERKVAKKKNLAVEVTQDIAIACNKLSNTSAQIRFLAKSGYSVGQIANILGVRYQHAYNVLHTIVKNK
jgi:hypothetical protein